VNPPAGFGFVRVGASIALVDDARRERLLLEGLARPALLLQSARPREGGRGGAFDLNLAGEDVVLRTLRRGGLVRFLLRDRTWNRNRSFLEVEALVAARERGVPVVRPVAAVATPHGFGLYRHLLLTLTVPDARDLLDVLAAPMEFRERAAAIDAAAAAVRAGFEKGIEPPDLHPRNLLFTYAPEPRCLWVDLDRARVVAGPLPPAVRIAALARFVRYLERHKNDGGAAMSRADVLRFLRGVETQDWKPVARAVWTKNRRARWWHRAGALWRPKVKKSAQAGGERRGADAPMQPPVSFVFRAEESGARRAAEKILAVAEKAGVGGFEIVALASDDAALRELRALSLAFPALRFLGFAERAESEALRVLLRSARGGRVVLVEPASLDPRFLTEALERLAGETDLAAARRAPGSGPRGLFARLANANKNYRARVFGKSPIADPQVTIVAKNDDRLHAALRALRPGRHARAELLHRLAESGARFVEISAEAR
jgi:hypothetical protein